MTEQEAVKKARAGIANMHAAVQNAKQIMRQLKVQMDNKQTEHVILPAPDVLLDIIGRVTALAETATTMMGGLYYAYHHPRSNGMPWRAYWSTTGRGFRLVTDPNAKPDVRPGYDHPSVAMVNFLIAEGVLGPAEPKDNVVPLVRPGQEGK